MTDRQEARPAATVAWERFDYENGETLWQRECPDCDRGLLLAPARFCSRCGGSGYLTTTVDPTRAVSAAISYRCQHCGKPVTVGHAAAWPSQCPHCKTAPPTLVMKVGGATFADGRTG